MFAYAMELGVRAVMFYQEQVERERTGGRKVYRTRNEDKTARILEKKEKKTGAERRRVRNRGVARNSDRDGNSFDTVIFVPYTVGGELTKRFKKKAEELGVDVKFVERSGYILQNQLDSCGRSECFPCSNEGGGDCEKRGAAYEIVCEEEECQEVVVRYDGETGRNGFTRGREHMRGYTKFEKKNTYQTCQRVTWQQEGCQVQEESGPHLREVQLDEKD